MPVGTQGAIKGVTFHRDLETTGAEIPPSTTIYRAPAMSIARGGDCIVIEAAADRQRGYQVFSLADRRTIDDEGVRFRSHLDGSSHLLTPESVVDIQAQLGSDVAMVLDECVAYPVDEAAARQSMERTARWAARARARQLSLRRDAVDAA
jgi:queuine tRNA-ribosyltransferase